MRKEILERAGKADLFHDAAHFVLDARDFCQTEIMYLICRHVSRRDLFQAHGIIGISFRQLPCAVICRCNRGLCLEFDNRGLVGRADMIAQRGGGAGNKRRCLVRPDGSGLDQSRDLVAEVFHKRAVFAFVDERVACDDTASIRQDVVMNEARREDSLRG